ncbi:Uncharacterized protein FWK35_00018298 [Aphis craccivora]|uniref:Uncharacterized protein n=1 Tax=Aphis craccivora TaxID=307492 RepID=A0A6G0X8F2_APHCR|nr:Uncharacterized protein FWK35_00018298 [Aphis craccivora]
MFLIKFEFLQNLSKTRKFATVTKYKIFSAIKAFDICFKIFHVFNVEYSIDSSDVKIDLITYYIR